MSENNGSILYVPILINGGESLPGKLESRELFIKDDGYGVSILNRDKNHVKLIIEGLKKKERYCPCRVQKTSEKILKNSNKFKKSKI